MTLQINNPMNNVTQEDFNNMFNSIDLDTAPESEVIIQLKEHNQIIFTIPRPTFQELKVSVGPNTKDYLKTFIKSLDYLTNPERRELAILLS
ncbi:MAG: hypothetical protein DRG78_00240 [Epsilonproteobacteria bacterium]|nr:MAG: hypothetical protein DRG78_00240 [Campylobacterota bacterium]